MRPKEECKRIEKMRRGVGLITSGKKRKREESEVSKRLKKKRTKDKKVRTR